MHAIQSSLTPYLHLHTFCPQVAPGAGGPSAPHVAPAKQSSLALAELQERMKKLKSAGAGGGEATDAPKSHADQ